MDTREWKFYRMRVPVKARQIWDAADLVAGGVKHGDYIVEDSNGNCHTCDREQFERDHMALEVPATDIERLMRVPPADIERLLGTVMRSAPVGPMARRVPSDEQLAERERQLLWQRKAESVKTRIGGQDRLDILNAEPAPEVQLDNFRYRERERWKDNSTGTDSSQNSPTDSPNSARARPTNVNPKGLDLDALLVGQRQRPPSHFLASSEKPTKKR